MYRANQAAFVRAVLDVLRHPRRRRLLLVSPAQREGVDEALYMLRARAAAYEAHEVTLRLQLSDGERAEAQLRVALVELERPRGSTEE